MTTQSLDITDEGRPRYGEAVAFRVPGSAAPQGSKTRLAHGGSVESSKRVKPWRQEVSSRAEDAMAGRPLIAGPVVLQALFVFKRGTSHWNSKGTLNATGRRSPYPYSRGDLDKLIRAIGDALTDTVLVDDKLIVDITGTKKRWTATPLEGAQTLIRVIPLILPEGD